MNNPALELADLLESWNQAKNHSSVQIRGGERQGDLQFWASQGRAVSLVQELEVVAAGLDV